MRHEDLKHWCLNNSALWPRAVQLVWKHECETKVSAHLGFGAQDESRLALGRMENVPFWGWRVTLRMSRDSAELAEMPEAKNASVVAVSHF